MSSTPLGGWIRASSYWHFHWSSRLICPFSTPSTVSHPEWGCHWPEYRTPHYRRGLPPSWGPCRGSDTGDLAKQGAHAHRVDEHILSALDVEEANIDAKADEPIRAFNLMGAHILRQKQLAAVLEIERLTGGIQFRQSIQKSASRLARSSAGSAAASISVANT